MEAGGRRRAHFTLAMEIDPEAESIPMVELAPTRAVVRRIVNDHRAPWRHVLVPTHREGVPAADGTT
jgi:hypothetical protein